jgi:hypothetical protein
MAYEVISWSEKMLLLLLQIVVPFAGRLSCFKHFCENVICSN